MRFPLTISSALIFLGCAGSPPPTRAMVVADAAPEASVATIDAAPDDAPDRGDLRCFTGEKICAFVEVTDVVEKTLSALPERSSWSFIVEHPDDAKLATLERIPFVTTLKIDGDGVRSLQGLSKMTALRALWVQGVTVKSLTSFLAPLAKLPAFDSIRLEVLYGTEDVDLTALTQLARLKRVELAIDVGDLDALAKLPSLESLTLSAISAKDFRFLAKLTGLRSLSLYDCSITKLPSLSALKHLERIDLNHDEGLTDFSALASLTALRVAGLSDSSISDLVPLSKLSALEEVYLARTKVVRLSPLAKSPNLRKVLVSRNVDPKEIESLQKSRPNATVEIWQPPPGAPCCSDD